MSFGGRPVSTAYGSVSAQRSRPAATTPGGRLKLLLTSAGIKNPSIQSALVDLLGKPISEASALCIPTAMYGHPWVGPGVKAWEFISGREPRCPMCELGVGCQDSVTLADRADLQANRG